MSFLLVVVAQLVRAPGCGPGGRGFESRLPPHLKISLLQQRKRLFYYLYSLTERFDYYSEQMPKFEIFHRRTCPLPLLTLTYWSKICYESVMTGLRLMMKPYSPLKNGVRLDNYYVSFRLNGKQISKSTGTTIKSEAEKWIKDNILPLKNQDNIKGLAETIKRMSLNAQKVELANAFDAFLAQPKRKAISEKAQKEKRSVWNDFTAFIQSHYKSVKYVHELDDQMCVDYINLLRSTGRYNKSTQYKRKCKRKTVMVKISNTPQNRVLSAKSCNEYLNTLKQVCETLLKCNEIITNPFNNIPLMEVKKESREAFTPEELKLIGSKADSFIYPIFALGVNTGLRKGDICTLLWEEVDLQSGWITREMRKTGKVVRIPIMLVLHNYLLTRHHKSKYVLPKLAKMYLENADGISYRFKKFLEEEIGIETTKCVAGRTNRISIRDIHSLRHTFVWVAAENNVPLPIIQSVVGHMTPKMTRMYADHATDKAKKEQLYVPNYLGLPEPVKDKEDELLEQIESILKEPMCSKEKIKRVISLLL